MRIPSIHNLFSIARAQQFCLLLSAAFVIAMPSIGVSFTLEKYAYQRIGQMWLLVLCALCLVLCAVGKRDLLIAKCNAELGKGKNRSSSFVILMIILSVGLMSALLARHTSYALLEWANWMLLLSLGLVFATQKAPRQRCIVVTVIISLALYFFFTLLNFIANLSVLDNYSTVVLWLVGFENQRFAAAYQVLLLPLLFLSSCVDCGVFRRCRFVIFLLAGFCLMLCAVTQSRGTVLYLAGTFVAVAYVGRQRLREWSRFLAVSAFVGLILGLLMFWMPVQLGWSLDVVGLRASTEQLVTMSARDVIWAYQY